MPDRDGIKLGELHQQPGLRRILDAIEQVEQEAPGLLEAAALAARELSKRRGGDGHMPE